jgi:hypothetical protein
MCSSDIHTAKRNFLHEKLLFKMDRIFNQEGSQTADLVIRNILESLSVTAS